MTDLAAAEAPAALPPVKKREIFGWAMYDFANSSYTTVVISVVYAAFFTGHIVPKGSEARDTYWAIAIVASTVLALLLAPLAGAICDYSGRKKRYLAYTTLVCASATLGLYFVGPGDVALAIGLLTISNAAFMLGESFCGSFLPDLATKENMGTISGLGWGLGYLGGLLSLGLVMFTIGSDPAEAYEAFLSENQRAMVVIGVFFVVAAIPTFVLVRERSRPVPGYENASFGKLMKAGFAEVRSSWALARSYKVLFRFLIAFMVYMAGLEVVIKFVGIYATEELNLTPGELIIVFLILQVSAALGALAFGFLEGKLGARRTVLATIGWWILGILAIYMLPNISEWTGAAPSRVFFVIALIAGAGLGSIQSSSRTVVGLLSPASRAAQMFGFWGMFARLAIILGMAFGPVSDLVGRRPAMLLVMGFFILGGILLWFVPIEEGIKEAAARDLADADDHAAKA